MPAAPAASVPFDVRPLTEPVDRAAVRAHTRQLRESGRVPSWANPVLIIAATIVGVVFLSIFSSVFIGIASSFAAMTSAPDGFDLLFVVAPVGVLVIAAGLAVTFIVRAARGLAGTRWYRLDRFARANGMSFEPVRDAPPLPGMIFGLGSSRRATDIVRGDRPRFVEFANYAYTTGSGKNRTTHHWGYVAVHLSSPLPHIVLDAVGNNSLFGSNLPASFDRDQRLSLEGDFDRHFALYCPEGYERDALYLFTPDIMARFIDHAAALDVEIVDDWLFFYAKREVSTLDPATWSWLFGTVSAVLDKLAQWERWRDDRLAADAVASDAAAPPASAVASPGLPFAAPTALLRPPPGVAPQGRRLKRGIAWPTIIVFGLVALWWFVTQSGVLTTLLGGLFGGLFSR